MDIFQTSQRGQLIISSNPDFVGFRDTLENIAKLLEMLEYIRMNEELTIDAEYGVFLTLETVIDALRYVCEQLNYYEVVDK